MVTCVRLVCQLGGVEEQKYFVTGLKNNNKKLIMG